MFAKILTIGSASALLVALASSAQATETLTGNATADNAFFAFVSSNNTVLGTEIGSGNDWSTTYALTPTTLSPGTHYLQIEAINYGGPGGFIGDFWVGGTEFYTTTAGGWEASFNNYNSGVAVQPWVEPTGGVIDYGSNGVGPWGYRGGINSSAQWLDSAGGGIVSNDGFATIDLSYRFTVPGTVPEASTWAMMGLGFVGLAFAGYRSRRATISIA